MTSWRNLKSTKFNQYCNPIICRQKGINCVCTQVAQKYPKTLELLTTQYERQKKHDFTYSNEARLQNLIIASGMLRSSYIFGSLPEPHIMILRIMA